MNIVWVTDISYIATDEGWYFLATVKDIFTKEIVGWAVADRSIGYTTSQFNLIIRLFRNRKGTCSSYNSFCLVLKYPYNDLLMEIHIGTLLS